KPPPPRQQLLHQPALELALGCDDGAQRVNDVLDPIEIECGLRTSLSALEHRYHNLSERGKMPTVTEVWNSAPGEDRKPVQVSGADTLILRPQELDSIRSYHERTVRELHISCVVTEYHER